MAKNSFKIIFWGGGSHMMNYNIFIFFRFLNYLCWVLLRPISFKFYQITEFVKYKKKSLSLLVFAHNNSTIYNLHVQMLFIV